MMEDTQEKKEHQSGVGSGQGPELILAELMEWWVQAGARTSLHQITEYF